MADQIAKEMLEEIDRFLAELTLDALTDPRKARIPNCRCAYEPFQPERTFLVMQLHHPAWAAKALFVENDLDIIFRSQRYVACSMSVAQAYNLAGAPIPGRRQINFIVSHQFANLIRESQGRITVNVGYVNLSPKEQIVTHLRGLGLFVQKIMPVNHEPPFPPNAPVHIIAQCTMKEITNE